MVLASVSTFTNISWQCEKLRKYITGSLWDGTILYIIGYSDIIAVSFIYL